MEDKIRKAIKEEIAKLHVAETMSPEEWEAAKEADRLDQHPEKDTINKIKQMMDKEEDDKEQAEYDKGWYGESSDYADRLANSGTDSDGRNTWGDKTGYSDEEMAQGKGKLKKYPDKDGRNVWGDKVDYSDEEKARGIDLNAVSYEKVAFVYTEQGGQFYGLDVYENKDQDQRSAKLKYDEANEWLKDTLAYIHEGDLIPRRYNSGLEDLDLIVARLEELGIEASHGDYMDVS